MSRPKPKRPVTDPPPHAPSKEQLTLYVEPEFKQALQHASIVKGQSLSEFVVRTLRASMEADRDMPDFVAQLLSPQNGRLPRASARTSK